MIEDPVVEEVHKARERILKEYGSSSKLVQHLREIEAEFKERVVRLPAKKPAEIARKVS